MELLERSKVAGICALSSNNDDLSYSDRKSTKVLIQPSPQPKQLTHLPQRPHVNIAFSDLTYTVREGRKKKEKIILKSVSGQLSSGELTAIMGPSGAGKSSLLNILTGYKTTGMKGSITINGEERNLNQFRKLSAYIMQDNQLHGNLTVGEAMNVATGLKLGREVNKDDRQEVIKEILDTLGLLEHSRTMTSNLSGGQKKRLSIALELVNNPPIMFFDEPTSGLDSSSCFQCIYLLKSLARGGRTIICTIHQPSARLFEMFDHLYTLADGQCVYQGSTQTLVPFMATLDLVCPSYHNPASFIIEVACGEYGDNTRKLVNAIENGKFNIQEGKPFPTPPAEKLNNAIQEKSEGNANITVDPAPCATKRNSGSSSGNMNWFPPYVTNDIVKESINGDGQSNNMIRDELADAQKQDNVEISLLDNIVTAKQKQQAYPISEALQFWLVLRRTLLFSRRDWTLMYLRLFAHILVGLLIGALYYDIGNDGAKVLSNLGFLFFNMLFLMYTSMTITILSFPLEMPVLIKEHFNRWYSLRSYYLAITVSDLPFQAVFCVIYVAIVYYFTSQPPEIWRFAMFLAACLLISFVAQSVGLVVGAAMNVQNGVFLAPVMSVPFLLFSGFFVSFDAIPIYLRWITYLSYIRYGFEGTALATYGYAREKLKCHQTYCHFKAPETTLEELDMVFSKLERPAQEAELAKLHAAASFNRQLLLAACNAAFNEVAATPSWTANAFGNFSDAKNMTEIVDGHHFLNALKAYEKTLEMAVIGGVQLPLEDSGPPASRWNLLQAVFFASTVLTTIGYGNMVPSTFWGRVFCMLYALVGIPLTLTVIADMGRLLASAVSELHYRVRRHAAALPAPPTLPARYHRPLTVLAALAALLLYLAAGSGIIRLWEGNWSFFEGFYFCFITMTTIGFGDYVPTKADYVMPCTLYILAGLALTSTIIELVRRQYAQSWRHLQALSGPLADSLRRLGENAALAGGGIDVTALQRMLTIVTLPKRNQGGGANGAKARADFEKAMAAVLKEIAVPPPRQPVLQIVIYETTV